MRRYGWRGLLVSACAAMALGAPAVAEAAPSWQKFADPPRGATAGGREKSETSVEMAVAGTTPYLTHVSPTTGELTVWRLNDARTQWVQVGEALNHDPGGFTGRASIAADGSDVWVAWTEGTNDTDAAVRVARLSGAAFDEVGDGDDVANAPGTWASYVPRVAVAGGRAYVAFAELTDRSRGPNVVRVSEDGESYESLPGLFGGDMYGDPYIGVADGRVYVSHHAGGPVPDTQFARLNSAGTGWEDLAIHTFWVHDMAGHDGALHMATGDGVQRWDDASGFSAIGPWGFGYWPATIASAGGTLYAAQPTGNYSDGFRSPRFVGYDGGTWQPLAAPPSEDGEVFGRMELAGASDGALWAMYTTSESSGPFPPLDVHVARYGEPPAPPADPPHGDPPPPADGGGSTPPPPGGGGFTDPGGHPEPVGGPQFDPDPPRGACAVALLGSPGGDRLLGSRLGDRIYGRAGADQLFGRAGADCLWGGTGSDWVSGGAGPDALSGGRGHDRIATGGGRDDVAAGRGNDRIDAVGGGIDRVNCGPGSDSVRLSRNDLIKNCERVIVRERR